MSFSPVTNTLKFEEILPWFSISGDVTLCEGASTGAFPAGSVARLIQKDQPISITFDWKASGLLVPFLTGEWKAEVYFEKMGGGEFNLPAPSKVASFVQTSGASYSETINIAANTVPVGAYRVVVALTFCSLGGTPGPVAAFSELGLIKVYEA